MSLFSSTKWKASPHNYPLSVLKYLKRKKQKMKNTWYDQKYPKFQDVRFVSFYLFIYTYLIFNLCIFFYLIWYFNNLFSSYTMIWNSTYKEWISGLRLFIVKGTINTIKIEVHTKWVFSFVYEHFMCLYVFEVSKTYRLVLVINGGRWCIAGKTSWCRPRIG